MTMKKKIGIAIAVIVVLVGSIYGLYRYYYPYGMDHRCDKGLWFALRDYAEKHNGKFPSGEATPEASLSLIDSLGDPGDYAYLSTPEGMYRRMSCDKFSKAAGC